MREDILFMFVAILQQDTLIAEPELDNSVSHYERSFFQTHYNDAPDRFENEVRRPLYLIVPYIRLSFCFCLDVLMIF